MFSSYKLRYKECIRMLNGLEKTLEQKIPDKNRRWDFSEENETYHVTAASLTAWPVMNEGVPEF
jgi:hypothetical protein